MNKILRQRIKEVLNNSRDNNSTNSEDEKENIYNVTNKQAYLSQISQNLYDNADGEKLNTQIFGIPYQFLPETDFRIAFGNNFGYGYFLNIYQEKPLVTLTPGKMLYLPAYSKDNKELFGSLMADSGNENSMKALKELVSENAESRYYEFASDYTAYMNYVNLMCRVAAILLGLDGDDPEGNPYKAPDGGNYRLYDWKKYHSIENYGENGEIKTKDNSVLTDDEGFFEQVFDDVTVGERCYVNFYIDPNTSVSESISNTTQASMLEGAFDSLEGIVKEADMLLNTVGKGDLLTNVFDTAESAILNLVNGMSFGYFKEILGLGKEVLHGSNLIYPEIWTESSYDKHFSVQINLASPYGTKEAVYLNILVPMFHLLCFALPRQSSANSFNAPFLIRGYAQGWFSIDMGIVESISIEKGPEQSWSVEGLPTEMKVTLNIKELYGNLMMSPSTKPSFFFANQGLLDYLGVVCGIDLTIPTVYYKFKLAGALLTGMVTDLPNNTYYKLTEWARKKLSGITGSRV